MFEKAAELGTNIKAVYSKVFSIYSTLVNIFFLSQTDRPGSQFWNSGMIASYSELAQEFGIPVIAITEQSSHNKVNQLVNCTYK